MGNAAAYMSNEEAQRDLAEMAGKMGVTPEQMSEWVTRFPPSMQAEVPIERIPGALKNAADEKSKKDNKAQLLFFRSNHLSTKDREIISDLLESRGFREEAADMLGKKYDDGMLASMGGTMNESVTWSGLIKLGLSAAALLFLYEAFLADSMGTRHIADVIRGNYPEGVKTTKK